MLCERAEVLAAANSAGGLNPCFNGICSAREQSVFVTDTLQKRLNPCFNGICSASVHFSEHGSRQKKS